MSALVRALLVVALTVFAAGPAAGAEPVNAAVTLDRSTITVGDRIAMNILVDAEPGFVVSDPTIARQIGPFEVIQTQAVQRSNRGSVVRYTFRYVITAWTLGDLMLPPIDVGYTGPNGVTGSARTAEMPVRVASVVNVGEDTSDIKPLKPQLALNESPWTAVGRVLAGLAVAALATLVVGLLLWVFLRRRGLIASEERLTPAQRALRELAALAEERLPEQGRTAEHYARLTASLRRYAVDRYGVLPGRTSRELRVALEQAGLDRGQTAAIFEILREGDEVRFRHATPYPAHAHNSVRAALEIVRRAASAEEYEIAALQPQ